MKKIELSHSTEILKHPDGEIDENVLESLLNEAYEDKIDKNKLVVIAQDKRVKNFDPSNPNYETKSYAVKLLTLYGWYKQITGKPFRPKTEEEKMQEMEDYEKRVQGGAVLNSLRYK